MSPNRLNPNHPNHPNHPSPNLILVHGVLGEKAYYDLSGHFEHYESFARQILNSKNLIYLDQRDVCSRMEEKRWIDCHFFHRLDVS